MSGATHRRRKLGGTLLSAVVPVALIAVLLFGGPPSSGWPFSMATPPAPSVLASSATSPAMAADAPSASPNSLLRGGQESLQAARVPAGGSSMGCLAAGTGSDRCGTPPTSEASSLQVSAPTAAPAVVDADHWVQLNVTASGGVSPYNFTWLGLPPGCPSVNASALSCHFGTQPSTPTYYSISVRVRDGQGNNVTSNSTTVQVNNLPSVGIDPLPSNVGTVPWNITLEALIKGGTPPFVCTWDFGDGSPNVTGNPVPHQYTIVGKISVTVLVNDSFGETYFAHAELHSVAPLSVQVAASPSPVVAGSNLTVQAQASGGLPPYSYLWSGLPPACAAASQSTISCAPRTAGSYVVSVRVQDSIGNNATNSSTLLVQPSASTASSSLPLLDILLAVAAAVVALAAVWAVLRDRRKQSGASPPPPTRPPARPPAS